MFLTGLTAFHGRIMPAIDCQNEIGVHNATSAVTAGPHSVVATSCDCWSLAMTNLRREFLSNFALQHIRPELTACTNFISIQATYYKTAMIVKHIAVTPTERDEVLLMRELPQACLIATGIILSQRPRQAILHYTHYSSR
jgi:hypothetical protein